MNRSLPSRPLRAKACIQRKIEKAARLGLSLLSNHEFVDGNKRIGVPIMLVFLEFNGIHMKCSDEELVELGLGVAAGTLGYENVLTWINAHAINC